MALRLHLAEHLAARGDQRVVDELERCRPWISAALAYAGGTHAFEDVAEAIAEGRMQLWPAPRGCLVTEIILFPRRTALNVFLAGGEMGQLFEMHDDLVAWAKAQGCETLMMAGGRKGWGRVLKRLGLRFASVSMQKDI